MDIKTVDVGTSSTQDMSGHIAAHSKGGSPVHDAVSWHEPVPTGQPSGGKIVKSLPAMNPAKNL